MSELPTPAQEMTRLITELEKINETFAKERRAASSSDQRTEEMMAANERKSKALAVWHNDALALIRKHPSESAVVPLIAEYVERNGIDTVELVAIVRKHHWPDPRISKLISWVYQHSRPECQAFAFDVAKKHPDRNTRGRAALTIGELAKWKLAWDMLPSSSRVTRDTLANDVKLELTKQAETYLSLAFQEYADVTIDNSLQKIGPRANAALVGLKNLPNLIPGKLAADIVGTDLDGAALKLSEHRGKVVLLVFWASWCGPCMTDVPHERDLAVRFRECPFVVIGVNGDQDRRDALTAVAKHNINWRSFACDGDGFGEYGSIPASWNVVSWPTTYVIDHLGVIRHRDLRGKDLDQPLDELITAAEQSIAKP